MSGSTIGADPALRNALDLACNSVGLNPQGAELLGHSLNAVYLLPSESVVIRLRSGRPGAAARSVALGRSLEELGAPVIRLYKCAQPVDAGDYSATFWIAARNQKRWQGADLALPLLALHELKTPPNLSEWDPFKILFCGIRQATWIDDRQRQWLLDESDRVREGYEGAKAHLSFGLIHGDAWIGNLLKDEAGTPILGDLDTLALGPVIYDLVPTAVEYLRFGNVLRHRTLAFAYGIDVTQDPSWSILRRIRELMTISAGLTMARGQLGVQAEVVRRIRDLKGDDVRARWVGYRTAAKTKSPAEYA